MRTGVVVAGAVVLVLGGLLLGVGFLDLSNSNTIPSAGSGSGLVFTSPLIGSGTASLSWSQGTAQFHFSVFHCSDASCQSLQSLHPIANGSGPSGSLSFPIQGGATYAIVATAGGVNVVPVTVSLMGITLLMLVGVIVVVVGGLLVVLGLRMKAKVRAVVAAEEPPAQQMFVTRPFTAVEEPAAAAAPTQPAYRPHDAEPSGPVYFEGSDPTPSASTSGAAAAPPAAPGGKRQPIQCPHCGLMNDFWLTNCRGCRRPLSSTG